MINLYSQVSGPVDLAQLQLENTELLEILQSKNRKVSNSHNYSKCSHEYIMFSYNIYDVLLCLLGIFQVIEERDVISSTRRKKNRKRQKLEGEETKSERLKRELA